MQRAKIEGGRFDCRHELEYLETDPSGRYGRYREVLGKGASKTVYRAFDEFLGIEVAWSQVKLHDVFRSPDELNRLYSEVHLLKNLEHESIVKFYTSWVDPVRRTFNFITELFTSGTLREYRNKHRHVNIRAVKNWARQILKGLGYLHGHDPPVIHRDIKCDNILVNGHLGEVKIGDLGLAAILRGSKHAHSVIGTPEFMAPELYEEEYNELVDVYSFGMCVLEMLTSEYPYSECSNPAQIYKKVTSGKLPNAFYRIQNTEARDFVGKCLKPASERLSALELLSDPFLSSDDDAGDRLPPQGVPDRNPKPSRTSCENEMMMPKIVDEDEMNPTMTITGTMNPDDDTIYLKVQITDKEGSSRNIYFPFDIVNDTAIDVAVEMVKELEITDKEPMEIATMIEDEILSLVPTWENSGLPRDVRQHSFSHQEDGDDDEDDNTGRPFFAASSPLSSLASLPVFETSSCYEDQNANFCGSTDTSKAWLQEEDDAFISEDGESSSSSVHSLRYSTFDYSSVDDDEESDQRPRREPPDTLKTNHRSTRFCPSEIQRVKHRQFPGEKADDRMKYFPTHYWGKLTRNRSLLDIRSQLLHRSLVEEIHKRRMFKTVGAVENIGYQDPYHCSDKASSSGNGCGNNHRRPSTAAMKQRFNW
ncbi:hypothetical protein MLD38_029802 [Melastoma candidum]|uniref:Uncharacterized protein n=1 Tax=Melastoma candidum TaxID=119954 RepID=A0ACB9N4X9_9MYRT|nr:hypothetical protein MLD38_029802 [Melastoma candidum]